MPTPIQGNNVGQGLGVQSLNTYNQEEVLRHIRQSEEQKNRLVSDQAKQNLEKNLFLSNVNSNAKPTNRQQMIQMDTLHNEQIEVLKAKLEEIRNDRDSTITKFNENEQLWTEKHEKVSKEKDALLEMIQSLKDDNKDLFIEIDKSRKMENQL